MDEFQLEVYSSTLSGDTELLMTAEGAEVWVSTERSGKIKVSTVEKNFETYNVCAWSFLNIKEWKKVQNQFE